MTTNPFADERSPFEGRVDRKEQPPKPPTTDGILDLLRRETERQQQDLNRLLYGQTYEVKYRMDPRTGRDIAYPVPKSGTASWLLADGQTHTHSVRVEPDPKYWAKMAS